MHEISKVWKLTLGIKHPIVYNQIHWRPHIRTMLNRTSLLFEQNLPGTDRIELIPSKKALIIVQKSPDNGTILYPRFVVNDNEFYFLLLHLQHL